MHIEVERCNIRDYDKVSERIQFNQNINCIIYMMINLQ